MPPECPAPILVLAIGVLAIEHIFVLVSGPCAQTYNAGVTDISNLTRTSKCKRCKWTLPLFEPHRTFGRDADRAKPWCVFVTSVKGLILADSPRARPPRWRPGGQLPTIGSERSAHSR